MSLTISVPSINPLNTDLNLICHLLASLETHHILHVSRIRVKQTTPYFTVLLRSRWCYFSSHLRRSYSHVSITDDKVIARKFPKYVTCFLQNTLTMNDIRGRTVVQKCFFLGLIVFPFFASTQYVDCHRRSKIKIRNQYIKLPHAI
jgi:hypothetical protein